jgi:hypothetical protein
VVNGLLMKSETVQFRYSKRRRRREFDDRRASADQVLAFVENLPELQLATAMRDCERVVKPMLEHAGEINGHKRSTQQGSDPRHSAGRNYSGPLVLAWREGSAAHDLVWLAHPYQGIGSNAES